MSNREDKICELECEIICEPIDEFIEAMREEINATDEEITLSFLKEINYKLRVLK